MKKSDRKAKWRNVSITSHNVDEYLEDLRNDTKGQFINQGVSINKDDPYQMGLLRLALLEPQSFSGFMKQLLADHFYKDGTPTFVPQTIPSPPPTQGEVKPSVQEFYGHNHDFSSIPSSSSEQKSPVIADTEVIESGVEQTVESEQPIKKPKQRSAASGKTTTGKKTNPLLAK